MIHTISAGVGERMQYITHRYNDTTLRFILKYPGVLDSNTLCAAAQSVIGSVDVLHASFIAKKLQPIGESIPNMRCRIILPCLNATVTPPNPQKALRCNQWNTRQNVSFMLRRSMEVMAVQLLSVSVIWLSMAATESIY